MPRLATRFGRSSSVLSSPVPLTDDQIRRVAPAIFAPHKHESRSERYVYVSSEQVLNGLRNEGFLPYMVAQGGSRIEGKAEFTKHMMRLRRVDQKPIDGVMPEIIWIGSHDGTSSDQIMSGMFRFICLNSMVTGNVRNDIRVRHSGNPDRIRDKIIEGVYTVLSDFDRIEDQRQVMAATEFSQSEQLVFAQEALKLRWQPDENGNSTAPINPEDLNRPARAADLGNDGFTLFNRVQERLVRGRQEGINAAGKRVVTRELRSIDSVVDVNRELWALAEDFTAWRNSRKVA